MVRNPLKVKVSGNGRDNFQTTCGHMLVWLHFFGVGRSIEPARRLSARSRAFQTVEASGRRLAQTFVGVIGLICGLILIVAGSCIMGRIDAIRPTPFAGGLEMCEGTPCFRGLIPGKTLWSRALVRLDDESPDLSLFPAAGGKLLALVVVDIPPEEEARLGDLLAIFGAPCDVDLVTSPSGASVVLHYQGLAVYTGPVSGRLTPDTRIVTLSLSTTQGKCVVAGSGSPAGVDSTVQRLWRGFATTERYLANAGR